MDQAGASASLEVRHDKTKNRKSFLERQLEIDMTEKMISPSPAPENASTSRFGRARKIRCFDSPPEKSPISAKTPRKTPRTTSPQRSPTVYKMNASNSPVKLVPSTSLDSIEDLLHQTQNLSRFSDSRDKSSKNVNKVYMRRDLIQNRDEKTSSILKNIFSPIKSPTKSPHNSSHLNVILQRSSQNFELEPTVKSSPVISQTRAVPVRKLASSNKTEPREKKLSPRQLGLIENPAVIKALDFNDTPKKVQKVEAGGRGKIVAKPALAFTYDPAYEELEKKCKFQANDLAWARIGTYPFWPCLITRDPFTGRIVKQKVSSRGTRPVNIMHVSYMADNGRRGWITESMLRPFHGLREFEDARNAMTPEQKKKDPKLYGAFFISDKSKIIWDLAVKDGERLLTVPKFSRIDVFCEMVYKPNKQKPKEVAKKVVFSENKRVSKDSRNISLSASLLDTLFSENDNKVDDKERSKSNLDVSDVVTACLDDMATKTGNIKIQKQSHMDRWLQKAKSKTPEKAVENTNAKDFSRKKKRDNTSDDSDTSRNTQSVRKRLRRSSKYLLRTDSSSGLESEECKTDSLEDVQKRLPDSAEITETVDLKNGPAFATQYYQKDSDPLNKNSVMGNKSAVENSLNEPDTCTYKRKLRHSLRIKNHIEQEIKHPDTESCLNENHDSKKFDETSNNSNDKNMEPTDENRIVSDNKNKEHEKKQKPNADSNFVTPSEHLDENSISSSSASMDEPVYIAIVVENSRESINESENSVSQPTDLVVGAKSQQDFINDTIFADGELSIVSNNETRDLLDNTKSIVQEKVIAFSKMQNEDSVSSTKHLEELESHCDIKENLNSAKEPITQLYEEDSVKIRINSLNFGTHTDNSVPEFEREDDVDSIGSSIVISTKVEDDHNYSQRNTSKQTVKCETEQINPKPIQKCEPSYSIKQKSEMLATEDSTAHSNLRNENKTGEPSNFSEQINNRSYTEPSEVCSPSEEENSSASEREPVVSPSGTFSDAKNSEITDLEIGNVSESNKQYSEHDSETVDFEPDSDTESEKVKVIQRKLLLNGFSGDFNSSDSEVENEESENENRLAHEPKGSKLFESMDESSQGSIESSVSENITIGSSHHYAEHLIPATAELKETIHTIDSDSEEFPETDSSRPESEIIEKIEIDIKKIRSFLKPVVGILNTKDNNLEDDDEESENNEMCTLNVQDEDGRKNTRSCQIKNTSNNENQIQKNPKSIHAEEVHIVNHSKITSVCDIKTLTEDGVKNVEDPQVMDAEYNILDHYKSTRLRDIKTITHNEDQKENPENFQSVDAEDYIIDNSKSTSPVDVKTIPHKEDQLITLEDAKSIDAEDIMVHAKSTSLCDIKTTTQEETFKNLQSMGAEDHIIGHSKSTSPCDIKTKTHKKNQEVIPEIAQSIDAEDTMIHAKITIPCDIKTIIHNEDQEEMLENLQSMGAQDHINNHSKSTSSCDIETKTYKENKGVTPENPQSINSVDIMVHSKSTSSCDNIALNEIHESTPKNPQSIDTENDYIMDHSRSTSLCDIGQVKTPVNPESRDEKETETTERSDSTDSFEKPYCSKGMDRSESADNSDNSDRSLSPDSSDKPDLSERTEHSESTSHSENSDRSESTHCSKSMSPCDIETTKSMENDINVKKNTDSCIRLDQSIDCSRTTSSCDLKSKNYVESTESTNAQSSNSSRSGSPLDSESKNSVEEDMEFQENTISVPLEIGQETDSSEADTELSETRENDTHGQKDVDVIVIRDTDSSKSDSNTESIISVDSHSSGVFNKTTTHNSEPNEPEGTRTPKRASSRKKAKVDADISLEDLQNDVSDNGSSDSEDTKQKKTMKSKYDDAKFMEYASEKETGLMDQYPHLNREEVLSYLYDVWSLRDKELKETQESNGHLDECIKTTEKSTAVEQPRKKRKPKPNKYTEFEETRFEVNEVVIPKEKPVRKKANKTYIEIDTESDTELDKESKSNIINIEPIIDVEIITEQAPQVLTVDENWFMNELMKPKPNLFKGLVKERLCEICELPGDIVKCKGHCGNMYHMDCVRRQAEPQPEVSRKKKKKQGRPRKSAEDQSLDASKGNGDSDCDNSLDETMVLKSFTIENGDNFDTHFAEKMTEELEKMEPIDMDLYSTDEELDWDDIAPGQCEIVNIELRPRSQRKSNDLQNFKCNDCQRYDQSPCFVCKKIESPKQKTETRQKCTILHCQKVYHLECLDSWPQTQFSNGGLNKEGEAITCPRHVCHTCVCDDPRGCKSRFSGDKLAKCVRCPAVYHSFTKCLPAGSKVLNGSHIICPRHSEHKSGKVPYHVNTSWCFICATGGTLICCEYCPMSFHADCLNIQPPEDGYMCEDCETGRLPLYGEMVWAKLGNYRWWPGIILHPTLVPDNVWLLKHSTGEFVVRFFGGNDHFWLYKGRVFPYQEGDTGKVSTQKSKIDTEFVMAVEQAQRTYNMLKEAKPDESESLDIASSLLPPHYIKLKVNKPHGSLAGRRLEMDEENSATQCDCRPDDDEPCSAYSQCLNRVLLTECGPTCRAGERCNNRNFEKRNYPKLLPRRTPQRGWGLHTLEDIKKGQFVIEYVGELIDDEEFRRRMRRKHETRDENFYFLTLDKDRMIDAGPKGNAARFMNHCCEPNCETQKWTVLGDVRVGLFAICDIPANSEVTFNYNLECAGVDKKKCLCGAKRCAGYIGAKPKQEEPQIKKPKRKYNKKPRVESPSSSTKTPPVRKYRSSNTSLNASLKSSDLLEIEQDLLIIQNATKDMVSDSELDGNKNKEGNVVIEENNVKKQILEVAKPIVVEKEKKKDDERLQKKKELKVKISFEEEMMLIDNYTLKKKKKKSDSPKKERLNVSNFEEPKEGQSPKKIVQDEKVVEKLKSPDEKNNKTPLEEKQKNKSSDEKQNKHLEEKQKTKSSEEKQSNKSLEETQKSKSLEQKQNNKSPEPRQRNKSPEEKQKNKMPEDKQNTLEEKQKTKYPEEKQKTKFSEEKQKTKSPEDIYKNKPVIEKQKTKSPEEKQEKKHNDQEKVKRPDEYRDKTKETEKVEESSKSSQKNEKQLSEKSVEMTKKLKQTTFTGRKHNVNGLEKNRELRVSIERSKFIEDNVDSKKKAMKRKRVSFSSEEIVICYDSDPVKKPEEKKPRTEYEMAFFEFLKKDSSSPSILKASLKK